MLIIDDTNVCPECGAHLEGNGYCSNGHLQPRAYTSEEVRDDFLGMLHTYAQYWIKMIESDTPEPLSKNQMDVIKEKVSGLIFSTLVIFDGGSGLPAFTIAPIPHPDDKAFRISEMENYYPEPRCDVCDNFVELETDIGGPLHESWAQKWGKNL